MKNLSLIILLFFSLLLQAQTPQGFSYQAVIRNSTGTPIGNKTVGVKITLENGLHVPYYIETHSSETNSQGVLVIKVGTGTRVGGDIFTNIPWATGDVHIKFEIDPEGGVNYTSMGAATELQAVPYALYAENTKEVVSQSNATDDEPIFVVKNKIGQIVFAVYQTGVRVYVSDTTTTKGAKGGFAIGGLTSKSISDSQDYFSVTPSSARIWLDNSVKGAKGGFAVGGLTGQGKAEPFEFMRITSDSARFYINDSNGKGAKGGFAIGGLTGQGKSTIGNYLQLIPNNYLIGHDAGKQLTSGLYNSFIGFNSGLNNTEGSYNIFIGHQSGYSNTVGLYNTFIGYQAGFSNIGSNIPAVWQKGRYNSYFGFQAGYLGDNSDNCVLIGYKAGYSNKASLNTFVGSQAGRDNQDGPFNTFIGYGAGMSNTVGARNTFIGDQSGSINKTGSFNVYIGNSAGDRNQSGESNVIIGYLTNFGYSGIQDGGSKQNVIIGSEAAQDLNGSGNVLIGYNVAKETTSLFNKLVIENSGDMTNPLIYGDFANDKLALHRLGTTHPFQVGTDETNGNGAFLSAGGVWTNTSSKSLKDRFIEINKTDILAKIMGLDLKGWFYKGTMEYHIGPFAEDFYDAFGTGDKNSNDANKTLSSSDVAGVSIIAIQELIKKNAEQNLKIEKLSIENEELKKRLGEIEKLIQGMSK